MEHGSDERSLVELIIVKASGGGAPRARTQEIDDPGEESGVIERRSPGAWGWGPTRK